MNKRSILLDVDEVICFSGYLEAINEFLETNYELDDFNDYYIDEVAIPQNRFKEFIEFINNRNLYEKANILPKAIETIKKLNDKYNIYICSACVNPFDIEGSGRMFKDRYEFLIKVLPFLKPENFIFTNAKYLFKADIQIDDRISNLENDIELKILFPSYHNKDVTAEDLQAVGAIRVGYDYKTAWEEIAKLLINEE